MTRIFLFIVMVYWFFPRAHGEDYIAIRYCQAFGFVISLPLDYYIYILSKVHYSVAAEKGEHTEISGWELWKLAGYDRHTALYVAASYTLFIALCSGFVSVISDIGIADFVKNTMVGSGYQLMLAMIGIHAFMNPFLFSKATGAPDQPAK